MKPEYRVTIALKVGNDLDFEEIRKIRDRLQEQVSFTVNEDGLTSNSSKYVIFTGEGPDVPYFKAWERVQTVEIFRALGPCAVTWVWQSEEGTQPYDAGYYSPDDCDPMVRALDTIQRVSTGIK